MKRLKVLWIILALVVPEFLLIGIAKAAGPQAVLSWVAPTTNTSGSPITQPLTYNVLQGQGTSISTCTLGATPVLTGVTGTTVTITGLLDGVTYCWAVIVVEGGQQSVDSNVADKSFPPPTPSPATNLTAQ